MKNLSGMWKIMMGCLLPAVPSFARQHAADRLQQPGEKKNIIFFLVDDMGSGDLGYLGNKMVETPHIDAFAGESAVFSSAYVAPESSPTRASLLTGKYPARLHITTWIPKPDPNKSVKSYTFRGLRMPEEKDGIDLGEYTVAEALKAHGYATCHVGKWHVGDGERTPKNQGFDSSPGFWPWAFPKSYFSPYGIPTLTDGPAGEYITDRLTTEAIRFIEASKDRPFFLNLWHYAVHEPLRAKQADIDRYLRKGAPETGKDCAVYSAMKSSVDDSFGRILSAVENAGIADRTVIIFLTDNGGVSKHADNGIYREGKKTLYEGGIRVPMIVRYPGLSKRGQVIGEPVSSVDFYPSLLEMAGIDRADVPQELDGVSFLPVFRDRKVERKGDALFWHQMGAFGFGPGTAILMNDYKMIKYYTTTGAVFELYHLKNDPSETTNIADRNGALVEALNKRIEAWVAETGAQMPALLHGRN
jgi:arylsulfatase A-like enzyme